MMDQSTDKLSASETEVQRNVSPLEIYRFHRNGSAMETARRVSTQKARRTIWLTLMFYIGLLLWAWIVEGFWVIGFISGAGAATVLIQWRLLHDQKKRLAADMARITANEYLIEIFEDGYRVSVLSPDREVLRLFSTWEEVVGAWRTSEYLIFYDRIMLHYLPVAEIAADSRLYTALAPKLKSVKTKTVASAETPREPVPTDISDNGIGQRISTGNPAQSPRKPASIGMLAKISKLFVVLTGLAIGAAFMLFPSMLWETNDLVVPGYALLLIFPVVCLILGILLSHRGGKGKGAVDLGIVGGLIIAVVGVCVFLLADTVNRNMNDDPTFVSEVTAQVGVTLPAGAETVYTMVYTADTTDPDAPTRLLRSADIALRGTAWTEFETQLAADGRWQQNLPTAQRGLLPNLAVYDLSHTTYVLIWRADGAVPNAAPETAGTYRYLCLLYEPSNRELNIYEYELDYIP